MGRQSRFADGMGSTVRRTNGRGDPRLRISALRYPLMEGRRVRNRQFGTTARRDAPRGNAPARLRTHEERNDAEIAEQNIGASKGREIASRSLSSGRPKAGPVGSQ